MASFLDSLKQKASDIFEKIPLIASDAKQDVKDYFEPQPIEDGLRIRDFLREVPGATGNLAKEIAQGTLRSLDFAGRKLTPWKEDVTPKSEIDATIQDFLFGGSEKRKDTLGGVAETEVGINPQEHPILAPVVGGTLVGLDLIPGGQGKSKGFKQLFKSLTDDVVTTLSKTTDDKVIETILKESAPKLTDNEVKVLTDSIKTLETPKAVMDTINRLGAGTKTTAKTADETVASMLKETPKTTRSTDEVVSVLNDAVKKNGSPIAKVTDGKDSYRVAFKNGRDPVLLNKNFLKDNFGIQSIDEVTQLTTKTAGSTPEVAKEIVDPATKQLRNPEAGMTFFHGTTAENKASMLKGGIDTSKNTKGFAEQPKAFYVGNREEALMYGRDENLVGIRPIEKVNTLDSASAEWAETAGRSRNSQETAQALDVLRARGYDAINHGDEIEILNPSKFEVVDIVEETKKGIIDELPEASKKPVAKALDATEKEITKQLSPRRMADMKQAGISEEVFGRALYSKAGGRLSHDEAAELADNFRAPIQDLLEKNPRQFELSRPKIEAYSQELQGYFDNVVKKLKAEALANPKDAVLQEQYTRASGTYIKARATLESLISEAGRVVEGSKVIGKYSRLPGMDGKIRKVRETIVEFANKNPEKYGNLPADFDIAIEGVNVNSATELLDFLTQWNRSSFLQKLSEFQKASLLSALSTHGVNALGNLIQQILDVPVRALAGGLDAVRAGVTRTPREVYAVESLAQLKGAMRAMPDAMTRAVKALGNEHYAQELRRTEIEAGTVVPAIRGRFGKIVRLPFRLLQAADLGFRTAKTGAEKSALAVRIAKHEGLKGKAMQERVAFLEQNLEPDMLDLIDARTERSLMLEDLDGFLKTVEDAKNKHPSAQFVIPFYRTLVNLSKEAYRMTPIGGVGRTVGRVTGSKKITNAFSNKWTADKNTRMEELSRQIIGTSIMALVVTKMLDGEIEITGSAPSKAGDREIFYGQGKQPHAIRIGDNWIPFNRVQPIGQLIQLGAGISDTINAYRNTGGLNEEEVGKEVAKATADIFSMVFTQSPFTGLGDFMNLLKGGQYNEGYGPAINRYVGQLAGTFIPNILRRYTVGIDPTIYEKRDITSQLQSRIPGKQDELTPKRTLFGEKVLKDGNFWTRFASPIEPSPVEENAIYDEFDRIGYTPTIPDRKAHGQKLSEEEYEILQLMYGPVLRDELTDLMKTDRYKRQNDAIKHKILDKISSALLKRAEAQLFPTYRQRKAQHDKLILQGYVTSEKTLSAEGQAILDSKFPVTPEESATYARNVLQEALQEGNAKPTIQQLLNQ